MATVQIHEMSALTTGNDKTAGTVRFKSADNDTVDNNDKLAIPPAGTDYSYSKQLRAYVDVAPDTEVENLTAYTDGANDFGLGVGVQYDLSATFVTQTDADIAGADLFTATDGARIDMDQTNDPTGRTDTGYWADLLRLQMSVASTSSPGTLAAETLTFAFDET